jgi:hypothetical protein
VQLKHDSLLPLPILHCYLRTWRLMVRRLLCSSAATSPPITLDSVAERDTRRREEQTKKNSHTSFVLSGNYGGRGDGSNPFWYQSWTVFSLFFDHVISVFFSFEITSSLATVFTSLKYPAYNHISISHISFISPNQLYYFRLNHFRIHFVDNKFEKKII